MLSIGFDNPSRATLMFVLTVFLILVMVFILAISWLVVSGWRGQWVPSGINLLQVLTFVHGLNLPDGFHQVSDGHVRTLQHVDDHQLVLLQEAIVECLLHCPLQFKIVQTIRILVLNGHLEPNQLLIVILGRLLVGLLYVAHLWLEMHVWCRSAVQLIQCL